MELLLPFAQSSLTPHWKQFKMWDVTDQIWKKSIGVCWKFYGLMRELSIYTGLFCNFFPRVFDDICISSKHTRWHRSHFQIMTLHPCSLGCFRCHTYVHTYKYRIYFKSLFLCLEELFFKLVKITSRYIFGASFTV